MATIFWVDVSTASLPDNPSSIFAGVVLTNRLGICYTAIGLNIGRCPMLS